MPNLQCLGIVSAVNAMAMNARALSGRAVGIECSSTVLYLNVENLLYV